MGLADDHASPTTPFSGDETGEIFDAPDVVLQSPTTTERVVDTQSGFLVVVRRLGVRSAISVKRRLGTPPVSSIVLTPDESLQLSRILANPDSEPDSDSPLLARAKSATSVSSNLKEWNSRFASNAVEKSEPFVEEDHEHAAEKRTQAQSERTVLRQLATSKNNGIKKTLGQRTILLSLVMVVALSAGIALASHWRARQTKTPIAQEAKTVDQKGPSDVEIDKFVRTYVSNLLDFSPETYRYSQTQAMSVMTPLLMSKYWQETNFPIPDKQLKNSLKRETLVITGVVQQPTNDPATRLVDVYAQLNGSDGKTSVPTHLQLKLALTGTQLDSVRVAEQNDLSASDK